MNNMSNTASCCMKIIFDFRAVYYICMAVHTHKYYVTYLYHLDICFVQYSVHSFLPFFSQHITSQIMYKFYTQHYLHNILDWIGFNIRFFKDILQWILHFRCSWLNWDMNLNIFIDVSFRAFN